VFQAALDNCARKTGGHDELGGGRHGLVSLCGGQHGACADQEVPPGGEPVQRLKAGGSPEGDLRHRDERVTQGVGRAGVVDHDGRHERVTREPCQERSLVPTRTSQLNPVSLRESLPARSQSRQGQVRARRAEHAYAWKMQIWLKRFRRRRLAVPVNLLSNVCSATRKRTGAKANAIGAAVSMVSRTQPGEAALSVSTASRCYVASAAG